MQNTSPSGRLSPPDTLAGLCPWTPCTAVLLLVAAPCFVQCYSCTAVKTCDVFQKPITERCDSLSSQPWYFGSIDREMSEEKLARFRGTVNNHLFTTTDECCNVFKVSDIEIQTEDKLNVY